jgi:hypothetical protein
MNRNTLTTITVALSLAFASGAFAQSGKPAAPGSQQQKQQKLVLVKTLTSAEQNREFQANVQLVQSQYQTVIQLKASMEKETDAKKKGEIKKQFDDLLTKLNENNAKMYQVYGFTLERAYVQDVVVSNIYLLLTDEEVASMEKAAKEQSSKAPADKGAKKK